MRKLLVSCIAAVCIIANAPATLGEDSFFSGIKVMFRAIQQCEENEILTCIKIRALKSIDRIMEQDEISLIDGISFKKVQTDEGGRNYNEPIKELDEKNLPENPDARDDAVDEMFLDRISRFFKQHSLKIDLGRSNSDVEEGRRQGGIGGGGGGGGNKKGNGGMVLAGMMAGGMGAIFLKGVAILAGKALLVAKLALVLATVLGLSKLLHNDHEKPHYHVVSSHGGGGGGGGGGGYGGAVYGGGHGGEYGGYGGGGLYGRSVDDFNSHVLAYGGHLHGAEGAAAAGGSVHR